MHETARLDQARSSTPDVASAMASPRGSLMDSHKARPALDRWHLDRSRSVGAIEWKALAMLAYDTTLVVWFFEHIKRWFA